MIGFGKFGAVLAICCLSLSACSSNKSDPNLAKTIGANLKSAIDDKRAGRPPVVILTAADIAAFNVPVLQINPQRFGGSDLLTRVARRSDSRGGTVDIWQSTDNGQVILNNGILVGTRGVGNDIIASDAALTISAVLGMQNGRGIRRYEVSDGDSTSSKLALDCTWANLGNEVIIVANQKLGTTHMRETCLPSNEGFIMVENHFWVQKGGQIRKSLQWAGPAVGYFELIPLNR